jgi:hypothetical protein
MLDLKKRHYAPMNEFDKLLTDGGPWYRHRTTAHNRKAKRHAQLRMPFFRGCITDADAASAW